MNFVDPLKLQRLADGELTVQQIKQVIEDADANPEQWPVIAKALIEDKIWANEILKSDPSSLTSKNSHTNSPADTRQASGLSWQRFLSIAAALMLAAVGGYLVADANSGDSMLSGGSPQLTSSKTPAQPTTPASFTPDYHLQFSENSKLASQGFSPDGQVPLYSLDNADKLREFQEKPMFEPVSRELMQKLTAAGYRINNDIELIAGDFDEKQRFVVPVRTIRLEPSQ